MDTTENHDKVSETKPDTTDDNIDDIFSLSDEDFDKLEVPSDVIKEEKKEEEIETEKEEEEEEEEEETSTKAEEDTESEETDSEEKEETDTDEQKQTKEKESTESDTESDDENKVDYKAEYDKIMAPFKANGIQLQAADVDEVVTLMQMGANYHKKMAGLKPSLKIVKLLDKHELLDAEKINYLIDLHNRKPEAITKLVKDSKIDPVEIDVESDTNYTPENRTVNDNELELDTVLDTIKDSPTYNRTLTVISDQWDGTSRQVIANNPHIIEIINEQMGSGIFDAINEVVARERNFGKLQGMTDLDAYKHVGDILHEQGKLPGQKSVPNKSVPQKTTKKKTTSPDKVKKQKEAVSPTKSRKTTSKSEFNPLSMSDEEFEKVMNKGL